MAVLRKVENSSNKNKSIWEFVNYQRTAKRIVGSSISLKDDSGKVAKTFPTSLMLLRRSTFSLRQYVGHQSVPVTNNALPHTDELDSSWCLSPVPPNSNEIHFQG